MNRILALCICLLACSPAANVAQTRMPEPSVERASGERTHAPAAPTITPAASPEAHPSPAVIDDATPRPTNKATSAPLESDGTTNASGAIETEGATDAKITPDVLRIVEDNAVTPGDAAEFALDAAAQESARASRDDDFRWRPALNQSLLFLGVQHGYAMTQPKTRRALRGEFFKDYADSVKSLSGWADGGRFFTNYVAHTMQGSFTGFIFVQNSPRATRAKFGTSPDYWKSRLKAMAWTAAWSTQFEIGPISQASIGNVGLSGKQTYIDLVVTPTIGTGLLITEDALDRFVIERIERRFDNFYVRMSARVFLNPTRTVANLIRFKTPWYRDRPRAN